MTSGRGGYLRLDPAQFEQARLRAGLSAKELFLAANVSEKTGYSAAKGNKIRTATARVLAKTLGISDLNELLFDGQHVESDVGTEANSTGLPAAWEIDESISPWITATNGLQYRVYRLKHQHLPEEMARGKCFDLDNMACEQAGESRDFLLVRHAQICRALASSSFFPTNQSVDIQEKLCWVIDSWPCGESLSALRKTNSIPASAVPPIMTALATALGELHACQIVLRDLHPDIVFYELQTGQLTILDLELAKLLDGSPTVVHGELTENPFRAPECVGHIIDHTADIFSWGQMLGWLVTGKTPNDGPPSDIGLPPKLLTLWRACLADSYRERPQSFTELTAAVKRWKP